LIKVPLALLAGCIRHKYGNRIIGQDISYCHVRTAAKDGATIYIEGPVLMEVGHPEVLVEVTLKNENMGNVLKSLRRKAEDLHDQVWR
jgi:hypothetical protein